MGKTCNNCAVPKTTTMPYIVHEADMARLERGNRRLWIVVLVLVAALIISNLAWVVYESQFEAVDETTVNQNNETGDNNYVDNDGVITYGYSDNR